jgi:predicted DNA-binding transcriptional regulator AlpA
MTALESSLESRIGTARSLADRTCVLGQNLEVPLFLSLADLSTLTGLSEQTLRRMEAAGSFPPLTHIGPRRRGLTLRAYIEWTQTRGLRQGVV